jgi:pantoate--beta-alanine ligase
MSEEIPVQEVKSVCIKKLEKKGFVVDYFEIADIETLLPVQNWKDAPGIIACVAAFLGPVRLIDNMILFRNFAG